MARLFDDAQNEYLQIDSTPITAAPLTMACWAKSDDQTENQRVIFIGDKDSEVDHWALGLMGDAPGDVTRFTSRDGTAANAETIAFTANVWQHYCGVELSSNSRAVYLNGGNKATETTEKTPDGADRITIGRMGDSSPGGYMSGLIAWAALWNVALNDAEVAALAAGAYPPSIRPQSLVAFWPMGGLDTTETDGGTARDIWGGYDLTAFSDAVGPGIADHPGGLIYPTGPLVVVPAPAAPGVVATPYYYQHLLAG